MEVIINASFDSIQTDCGWDGCSYDCSDWCSCDSYCRDW